MSFTRLTTLSEVQAEVDASVMRLEGYWPTEKILMRLAEEVGEVCRAHRKESPERVEAELGDVLYTVVAYANSHNLDISNMINLALSK